MFWYDRCSGQSLGIAAIAVAQKRLIFLNLARDEITIFLSNNLSGTESFNIYHTTGELIKTGRKQLSGTSATTSLKGMPTGAYFIQCLTGGEEYKGVFVKE